MNSNDSQDIPHRDDTAGVAGKISSAGSTLATDPESVDPMISKSGDVIDDTILKLVGDVERALGTSEPTESIDELRTGWQELLKVVGQTGELILNAISSNEVDIAQDILTMQMNHLTGLSQASAVLVSIDNAIHEDPLLGKPSQSFSKSTREDESLEEMIVNLRGQEVAYEQTCHDVAMNYQLVRESLESEVDKVLDNFSNDSLAPFRSLPTEFALISSPEGLDIIKKSDSMRWLNDVLKWQVRDLNLQIQQRREIFDLQQEIARKKDVIKGIVRDKLLQSASIRKLHAAKTGLDLAIDGLYKISTASSTAASSPPTTASQMVQSDVIKHLIDENSPECADVYPYVGY